MQRIADLINEGRAPGDIAVLYRAHHHSVDLQLALAAAGVEFELFSGARFVESAHVKDVLAFCRLRHNPRDELAWRRALRLFDRVGAATAARIWGVGAAPDPLAAAAALAARRAGRGGRARASPRRSADVAARPAPRRSSCAWRGPSGTATTSSARTPTGATARATSPAWPSSRPARRASSASSRPAARRAGRGRRRRLGPARRVALSSVHQAKGLEWPVVFVLQVEPGSFPSGWAVSEGNLDEEERLFYVAVTRAADELYLCRPIAARRPWDTGPDAVVFNSGQGFLDRDLAGLVEEWSVR